MPGFGQDERHACPFDNYFVCDRGATPESLLRQNIYQAVSVALKGGAWREVSLASLAQALAEEPDELPQSVGGDHQPVASRDDAFANRVVTSPPDDADPAAQHGLLDRVPFLSRLAATAARHVSGRAHVSPNAAPLSPPASPISLYATSHIVRKALPSPGASRAAAASFVSSAIDKVSSARERVARTMARARAARGKSGASGVNTASLPGEQPSKQLLRSSAAACEDKDKDRGPMGHTILQHASI